MSKVYSVILAGGSGYRLWPISRKNYPKQFIRIDGETLLEETINRNLSFSTSEEIFISTTEELFLITKRIVRKTPIPLSNILLRNNNLETAGATLSTILRLKNDFHAKEDDIVILQPSDHRIKDIENFKKYISKGVKIANKGYIVSFSIRPDSYSTELGYLKIGKKVDDYYLVEEFKEKPDLETAKQYVDSGYYWNSGIFIFSIKIILDEFNRFYPEIFQDLENNLENKESLDKAIIEKTDRLVTILADFDWADVGSWKQIYRLEEKDENNNFLVNENKFEILEVSDSLLIGGYKQIALIGLRNIAVIDAYDVLAIFNLDDQNKIKTILKNLEDRHGQKFLLQKPFVSVVTTVFTYREEVKEAIRSVVDQDYPYIEHIIVDYGNNEEWYKELEDYIKTFDLGSKEIYIVREKQSWPGVYPAMNRGLREVTGEIIGILNADDIYYDQSVISTVVDSFLSEKWDMCWGDLIYVSRKDLTNITRFWRGENYSPGSYKKGWQAPHPTLFVRREVYEKFGYYREDIPIAADYEFMIRILEKHRLKGCYINKLLAKMREGGESNWKNILRVLKGNYSVYRSIKSLGLKFNPFYIFLKLLKKIIQIILK